MRRIFVFLFYGLDVLTIDFIQLKILSKSSRALNNQHRNHRFNMFKLSVFMIMAYCLPMEGLGCNKNIVQMSKNKSRRLNIIENMIVI